MKQIVTISRICGFIILMACLAGCFLGKYEQVSFGDVRLVRIDTIYRYTSSANAYNVLLVLTWMNKGENEWYTSFHPSEGKFFRVGMSVPMLRKR